MKKTLIVITIFLLGIGNAFAQNHLFINLRERGNIIKNKIVERQSFPTEFQIIQLDVAAMQQILKLAPERFSGKAGVNLLLPNADGNLENYTIYEYSNFELSLQRQYPQIKSYFAINNSDKTILRMSSGLNGFSFISFKNEETEFMEPYSNDLTKYAVYKTTRQSKELPFTCSTADSALTNDLLNNTNLKIQSSNPELLTFRLALSCTGEYGTYFGGTVVGALSQMNTTMTNVNAVFEKDLSIKMNIIADNSLVMYFDATSDPYSVGSIGSQGLWNSELENTLNTQLGLAAFDIGHLFGSTGGGGNAGCIGCVCQSNKGRGFTSPNSGPASGPGFDIDYVSHELGHQYGGRHTFSHGGIQGGEYGLASLEPGSGSTIMSYAGITLYDIVSSASPYFHGYSVQQIQDNMVGKTCPVRTPKNNVAPVVNAGADYTIPISTPFVLEGIASDANGDPITYCWEQNNPGSSSEGLANSTAGVLKAAGPNFRSYSPTTNSLRYFPILSRTIANQKTTNGLDANMLSEALCGTYRTLNFMLTVRDNSPNGGLTKRDDMIVEVNPGAGPFEITAPNTGLSWAVGTNQTITWNVAGTTANSVNAKFVNIYLSTDGGNTYPILLASKVPNDGSETIVVPNNIGATNRVMVKGFEHIFFDISNANFSITAPSASFAIKTPAIAGSQNKSACQGSDLVYNLVYETYSGFAGTTNFSVSGLPAGLIATFTPTNLASNGNTVLTLSNTASFSPGQFGFSVNAVSDATTKNLPLYLEVENGTFATQTLTNPADNSTGTSTNTTLSWTAVANATLYTIQIATNSTFTNIVSTNTVSGTNLVTNLNESTQYFWRVLPRNSGCTGTYSSTRTFKTGITACSAFSNNSAVLISATGTPTINSVINVPNGALINDVNVTLNITHTNVNQLTALLTNPQGTQVYLVANPCTPGTQNILTTFDDEAVATFTCAPGAFFQPTSPLDAFDNVNSAGNWILEIQDNTSGNGGSLNSWSIDVCGFQALSNIKNQIANFSLYPNPNDGIFTVQFDGDGVNPVKIDVYDVRGRMVSETYYKESVNFKENINLDQVESGLYFINIKNGDKHITKKFIKK